MRRISSLLAAGVCLGLTGMADAGGIATQDLNQGVTIDDVVAKLVGPGVTVSNITFTGDPRAVGLFNGGTGIIGFESGIVLSSGRIQDVVGPNVSNSMSTNFNNPGDPTLDGRGQGTTLDAAVLEFTVECDLADSLVVRYVFGSEEYNEFVNTGFNDVFGLYVNGSNVSTIGANPVAINTINCGFNLAGPSSNCAFFINNSLQQPPAVPLDTELDGITVVLTAIGALNPGPNTIKIAIADVGDRIYDSAIFLENGSVQCASQLSCGAKEAGDCCDINNTPFCNDEACCAIVCSLLPACCEEFWDVDCAATANKECDICNPISPKGTLSFEAEDCQDDAYPDVPGQQVEFCLWMRNLTVPASGFQAFALYDTTVLNYNAALSSYTAGPFPLHIRPTALAETAPGELEFDGSVNFNAPGVIEDAKLVTIVFDVKEGQRCNTTGLDFGGSNFDSELSINGVPIPTNLNPGEDVSLDDNPPSIKCPENIKVPADVRVNGKVDPCLGAVVHYELWAEDDCDEKLELECGDWPSGSFFPIGTTIVTCTATDACGNQSSCEFSVTVNATNLMKADIFLWGSEATDRCIHFVTSDCAVFADVTVEFGEVENGAKGSIVFEIPCGDYSFLCAKDEQHTKWDTVLLGSDQQCWYGIDQHVLYPGDDDNDGDVDINDVTWLIATFGNLAADGGCSWNGTRDADFNNGGAVQSEDYSLLSGQWLTKSSCLCNDQPQSAAAEGGEVVSILVHLMHPATRVADLDRNGVFDWRDVRTFELANGLPETLSRRMRTHN